MTQPYHNTSVVPDDLHSPAPDGDVIEMPLLLPGWQMAALETAAHARGMTAAEVVRRLVRDFIGRQPVTSFEDDEVN